LLAQDLQLLGNVRVPDYLQVGLKPLGQQPAEVLGVVRRADRLSVDDNIKGAGLGEASG
jgi:hypothetical protein